MSLQTDVSGIISSGKVHFLMWTKDTIFSITQSLLSVILVLGGMTIIFTKPEVDSGVITGLMGAVIGYYFSQASAARAEQSATNTAKQVIEAQKQ